MQCKTGNSELEDVKRNLNPVPQKYWKYFYEVFFSEFLR